MGDVRVNGPNSPLVKSTEEMIGRFQAELVSALPGWKDRVTNDPGGLEELEREVQQTFDRGAGLVIAGLVALKLGAPEFAAACEQTRREFAYPTFRGQGLPLGSGAIESGIRRVINLRLKGNSIDWREPAAESMLQIRAQVLTDHWDDRMKTLRQLLRQDARTTWAWIPQNLSSKFERDTSSAI